MGRTDLPSWVGQPDHLGDMELVVLFGILALLGFGPRRGGGMRTRIAMISGAAILVWLLAASGLAGIWEAVVGTLRRGSRATAA